MIIFYNVFVPKFARDCHASMSFNSNKDGCGKKHATSCSAILLLLILVFLLQYILGHTYWMHGITATAKRHALLFSRSLSLSFLFIVFFCHFTYYYVGVIIFLSFLYQTLCVSLINHMDQFRHIHMYRKNRLLTKNNVMVVFWCYLDRCILYKQGLKSLQLKISISQYTVLYWNIVSHFRKHYNIRRYLGGNYYVLIPIVLRVKRYVIMHVCFIFALFEVTVHTRV